MVMSHHGHSACDAIDSGRSAHTKYGPPLGSPLCEKSQCNHDAIMITVMSHHGHSACKVIVRWQSARSADHGRCTLHPTPTPTRHRAPHTDQMSPTARTARPTPRFHAYFADSIYVALVQERAFGMVCNVQVRALWPCGSDAPRLDLRACRLAIEWPLAATPEPLRCLHRSCRLHVGMRSDRGGHS